MKPTARGFLLAVAAVTLTALALIVVLHPPQPEQDPPRPPDAPTATLHRGPTRPVVRFDGTYADIAAALSEARRPTRFAAGTGTVYLAPQDAVGYGATAMSFDDGPVFFIPRSGPVASAVRREIDRLAPATVVVCGSARTFATGVVAAAAGQRRTIFAGQDDRFGTNQALLALPAAKPAPHTGWLRFVTDGYDEIATAIAGTYPGHPPLLISPTDPASRLRLAATLKQAKLRLVSLTPRERLPAAVVQGLAGPDGVVDVARTDTPTAASVLAARQMHDLLLQKTGRDDVDAVVIVNQNDPLLAITAGLIPASRVLVLPPDGSASPSIVDTVRALRPRRIVGLGDGVGVPSATLHSLSDALATSIAPTTSAPGQLPPPAP